MKHIFVMALFLSSFALTACNNEGPAERMGREIDEAVTDAGNAIEDACEDATGRNC